MLFGGKSCVTNIVQYVQNLNSLIRTGEAVHCASCYCTKVFFTGSFYKDTIPSRVQDQGVATRNTREQYLRRGF